MPYSGNPASSAADLLRFTLGDTLVAAPILTDAEIAYLIATYGTAAAAAPFACDAIVGKYSGSTDYTAGRVSRSFSQRVAQYERLGKLLRAQAARYVAPISTGQDVATDRTDGENQALKQPQFAMGQEDNPEALGPRVPLPSES